MEQEVARWLFSQLGYNAAADATLSSNCRGNLKGLWEFIIANAKTAESKRHIQHVLAKHRREQEAARRAPEQQREAEARRKRLNQLRKRNAELQQALSALHVSTGGVVCAGLSCHDGMLCCAAQSPSPACELHTTDAPLAKYLVCVACRLARRAACRRL